MKNSIVSTTAWSPASWDQHVNSAPFADPMASQMVDNKREAFSQLMCSPVDSADVAGVEGAISLCRNRGARATFSVQRVS
jgi:hypothetical protein